MKRVRPYYIQDTIALSRLLEQYIRQLEQSPLQVPLRALSYNTQIPEGVLRRLMNLHHNPDDTIYIQAEDYHIVFANIMFRYPTLKIWQETSGAIIFEL